MFSLAKNAVYTIMILYISFSPSRAKETTYKFPAVVEKIRSDNVAELLSKENLTNEKYKIYAGNNEIGEIAVVDTIKISSSGQFSFRIICRYSVIEGKENSFRAGNKIALVEEKEVVIKTYVDKYPKEDPDYKKRIITYPDNREMVFVSSGRIRIGSDDGEKNESPSHIVMFEEFYIDKYEVSNSDYYLFVKTVGEKYPKSWNGEYPADKADFPVLVTYYEAEKYAKWAGKALPTEEKWEYAANFVSESTQYVVADGLIREVSKSVFPWGDRFIKDYCNSADFWSDRTEFNGMKKGYLPVRYLEDKNISGFGAVNMSGNAAEWTSSWYDKYEKSLSRDKRYGKQMKVVRGGSWFNNVRRQRISARDCGGIPSLHDDNSFGFRCIKKAGITDILK